LWGGGIELRWVLVRHCAIVPHEFGTIETRLMPTNPPR
jgi:hypothetical protein